MKKIFQGFCKAFVLLLTAVIVISLAEPLTAEAAAEKINKKKLTLTVGKTYKLKIKSAKSKYTWTSDKPSVVKVKTAKGKSTKITAVSEGNAAITATNAKGKTFTCKITVKNKEKSGIVTPTPEVIKEYSVSSNSTPVTIKVGEKVQLVLGVNKTAKRFYVNDSDKGKLNVTEEGLVTGIGAGSGYVKVETTDYN